VDSKEIRRALPRTYVPFFGHFGSFTPIQEISIPKILRNKNVVVISPSASGKTEAVIAPVLENLFGRGVIESDRKDLKVLYISPTRALVNDLYRRVSDPIGYLNLTLGIKTGDRPHLNVDNLPHVLLTTPESFDSLLTRRPRIFSHLESVILDEIHLLDNTARGDQLRILLNRLRRIRTPLHYAALSATIDDLRIGDRYFGDSETCLYESPREIEYHLIPAAGFATSIMNMIMERRFMKILVFFNARSLAELYAQKLNLPPFLDRVHVHHASLPKTKREEIEKTMNSGDRAILCATTTLELGIDIGSVDCVVLFRPPFDVSSLLQRVGRGNRRTQGLFAIGVYTNGWEKMLFDTFFECARHGRLYSKRYTPTLSVIPQQIYSYLYQRRRIGTTLNSLNNILSPVFPVETVRVIFRSLYEGGKLSETRPGIYFNSSRMEKKIDYGKIHSNIAETSFGEYDVINVSLGTMVGRVFHLREKFVLSGKCWQISRIDEKEKRVYARCTGDASAVTKVFEGKGTGSYNFRMAPAIKDKFIPGIGLEEFPYAVEAKNTHILHLLGTLYGFIWADALFHEGIDAMDVDGKILVLNSYLQTDDLLPVPGIESIKKVVGENIQRLEDALGSGAYFYDLPYECQIEDHVLGMDIHGFLDFLGSLRLRQIDVEEFRRLAKTLQ